MKINILKRWWEVLLYYQVWQCFFRVTTICATCNNSAFKKNFPQGEAYNFKLVYTDSTKVVAVVTSPLNKDYTNQRMPYSEFPEGVKVEFYDQARHKKYCRSPLWHHLPFFGYRRTAQQCSTYYLRRQTSKNRTTLLGSKRRLDFYR